MLNLEKKYFIAPLCDNFFSDLGKNHAPSPLSSEMVGPLSYRHIF